LLQDSDTTKVCQITVKHSENWNVGGS